MSKRKVPKHSYVPREGIFPRTAQYPLFYNISFNCNEIFIKSVAHCKIFIAFIIVGNLQHPGLGFSGIKHIVSKILVIACGIHGGIFQLGHISRKGIAIL